MSPGKLKFRTITDMLIPVPFAIVSRLLDYFPGDYALIKLGKSHTKCPLAILASPDALVHKAQTPDTIQVEDVSAVYDDWPLEQTFGLVCC